MLIGREEETRDLLDALDEYESQFLAVYGRRRVGKTHLVREVYRDRFVFCHAGLANAGTEGQLEAFRQSLCDWLLPDGCPTFKDWHDAFYALVDALPKVKRESREKMVVFLDELPWMDRPKSNLISALEHVWNQWLSARHDIVLVVCGSSSSWMVRKVFRDHGGLYGRLNRQIRLVPFSLRECELYCEARGLALSRTQILDAYMVFGGVPFYWSLLRPGESVAQAVDRLCFAPRGELAGEFRRLVASLFRRPEPYAAVASALGTRNSGLSRKEISVASGVPNGGTLTKILEDLEWCGFVRRDIPPGRKERDSVYQLIDAFSLFHLRFLAGAASGGDPRFWEGTAETGARRAWRGLAFERVCLVHAEQIKRALGIAGVHVRAYAWRRAPGPDGAPGAQVDLVLDRADGIVDLCEMKCTDAPFALDKAGDEALRRRESAFRDATKTRKAIHHVLVSAAGRARSQYMWSFQNVVALDDLFRDA